MEKTCSNCGEFYWARWRNEPVTLCPECRLGLRVCEKCGALDRAPADPSQLVLFPLPPLRGRLLVPDENEKYVSMRVRATRAKRVAQPFH